MALVRACLSLPLLISFTSSLESPSQEERGARVSRWAPYSTPLEGQCPDLQYELTKAQVVLKNLEEGMLDDMCGDTENRVIVTSMGDSSVRQPTRFGLYFLHGWSQHETDNSYRYPSYYRPEE